ncbi:MAG: type II toxin-antitoxin system VapC family toxin [Candidatus Korobacteraceae bacterium]
MKKYLLDTNVVSETRKPKPHGAVVAWLTALRDEQVFLSAVTMGELQAGIELTRRQDPEKASEIERWVDQLEASHQILPMDTVSFRDWGRLMHGKSDHLIEDGMIAATARKHDLIVATRNEDDFKQLGVPVFNPFKVSP